MALNPSGAISLGGPSTGQSIAVELGLSPTVQISLNDTNVRTLAQVPSGTIIMPTNFWGKSAQTNTQQAIFGYGAGAAPVRYSITNKVSNTGIVSADTAGVGTARFDLGAATYGGDKAIYGFGRTTPTTKSSITNLVSNTGVVAGDTATVGTARSDLSAAGYGGDKAIFGWGQAAPNTLVNATNLVSNTGVVASNTAGLGTVRYGYGALTYGGDKAIFAFGSLGVNISNLISNTGVIASNSPGVGTGRRQLTQATFGGDKGIMCWGVVSPTGAYSTATNQISNTGIVAADVNTPGGVAGGLRSFAGGCGYGGDKGIMAYGFANPARLNTKNLVSNTAVLTTNLPGIGTARAGVAAAGFSLT